MNFRLAAQILARLFVVLGVAMLPCAAWSASEGDTQSAIALLLAAGICAFTGLMSWAFGRKPDPTLRIRDALFVVTVGWFAAGVLSACPYFLSGAIPRFHDAYFEAISGFSTTGSTILQDIEALPAGLHIWRMMTHWLGGIGIVVIFVALFPQLGVGAKHLFKSEVPGPITEGLRPKVKQTALVLTLIYVGLTGSEALLLWGLTPMSAFEAILHSMSTMATGGFSTRNASIAGFQSPSVEWIIILFMYLAGINFALYFSIFTGRGKLLFRNFEWRTYTLIIIATTTVITWLIMPLHGDLYTAGRNALFQVLAIATTTGFGTDDFEVWAPACQVLLLGLMFMGGSAGSTAGGMKTSRIIIMIKSKISR